MADTSMNTVINHYDGIFKFVHSEGAKKPFLEARKCLATGKLKDAEKKFLEAQQNSDTVEDRNTVELIMRELRRYNECKIPADTPRRNEVNWEDVKTRDLARLEEKHDVLPQGIFILNLPSSSDQGRIQVIGRKTLSNLWIQDKIPEIFCSQVRADMLVGMLVDWRITDSKVVIFYHALSSSEKLAVFHLAAFKYKSKAELVFPVPLLKTLTSKEFSSPTEGWDVDPDFDHTLSHGEEHIREFTIATLQRLKLTSHRLYDPACSTGVFLSTMKKAFPSCTTIGQDLSQMMCNVAKARVDEVHCGNAMNPQIAQCSADVVFNRFLNSEVVTSADAEVLLAALIPTVAVGGIMITFGHTPVLLSSSHFRNIKGFEMLSNIGVANDSSSIFQCFVIRRIQ